jgi:hypothetical protein
MSDHYIEKPMLPIAIKQQPTHVICEAAVRNNPTEALLYIVDTSKKPP